MDFGRRTDSILAIRQQMRESQKQQKPFEIRIVSEGDQLFKVFGTDPNHDGHDFGVKFFSEDINASMYAESLRDDLKNAVIIDEAVKAKNPSGYFSSYSTAVQAAEKYANDLGFEVDEDVWFQKVSTQKKPSKGKTVSITLPLIDSKTKKEVKRGLTIQVYYDDGKKEPNVYELNCYVS